MKKNKKDKSAPFVVKHQSDSDLLNIADELDVAIRFADGIWLAAIGLASQTGAPSPIVALVDVHTDKLREIRKLFQQLRDDRRIEAEAEASK